MMAFSLYDTTVITGPASVVSSSSSSAQAAAPAISAASAKYFKVSFIFIGFKGLFYLSLQRNEAIDCAGTS